MCIYVYTYDLTLLISQSALELFQNHFFLLQLELGL